jgi:molybdenum-dependent DNA-binding transcriptional regulator ModE
VVSIPVTAFGPSVAKAMDKRREIPGSQKPNSAPRADVDRVLKRISELGLDVHVASKAAGLSRMTGYRFLDYEASVGSLRTLEEWVVKEEAKRQKTGATTTREQHDQLLAEWTRLGEELVQIAPARFADAMDGLRDMIESVRLQQRALHKMFRPTPDGER